MKHEGVAALTVPPATPLQARSRMAMLVLLALFFFTLPLWEAPKNIAAVLFVLAWCVHAAVARDLGGRWNRYDTAFAALLGSALLSGALGYAGDLPTQLKLLLPAWLLSRARLTEREFRPLAWITAVALLLAIPPGLYRFLAGERTFLELRSLGQVNQSAVYVALLASAAFGWWLQSRGRNASRRTSIAWGGFAALFWATLLLGASRASILAAVVACAVIGAGVWYAHGTAVLRKLAVPIAAGALLLAALLAGLAFWGANLSDGKLAPDRIVNVETVGMRMQHWRIAFEGWRQKPVLGWGPDYFQRFKVDEVCAWRAQRGEACDRSQYMTTKHAHSLYVGTLAERGIVGILALLLFLATWAGSLAASARTAATSPLWVASAAALVVAVVAGFFNSTLRVEHGALAFAWFAFWISAWRRDRRDGEAA